MAPVTGVQARWAGPDPVGSSFGRVQETPGAGQGFSARVRFEPSIACGPSSRGAVCWLSHSPRGSGEREEGGAVLGRPRNLVVRSERANDFRVALESLNGGRTGDGVDDRELGA